MKIKSIQSALTIGLGAVAFATTVPTAQAQEGLEQVFVTARKRDEGVQAVPIAMTALSSEALDQRGVKEVQDLNVTVPGFRFGAQGGKGNSDVILRGLSKIPVGEGMPAVVNYFANVALPGRGGNIPMYDIANIQVLKGPQGTLFGRNTLGGAVVITPVAPTYEWGGYIRAGYGTKNNRLLEGALNVPIVDDKLALRVAGQVRRQDGLMRNLNSDTPGIGGDDFQDAHQNSYRVSLLFNPTDNIENLLVYDHLTAPEMAAGGYLFRLNPFALGGLQNDFNHLPTGTNVGDQIAAQLAAQLEGQKRAGFHAGYTDFPGGGYARRNLEGVSNDTSWNMGWATLRNIFGYRRVHVAEGISSSATGPINIDFGAPLTIPGLGTFPMGVQPFTLFHASQVVGRKYLSDEVQLFGSALDDRLDWITGYYYNKDESAEPNGSRFAAFYAPGTPFFEPVPPVTAHTENKNWAVFAQGGLDLSDWVVEGLKLNLGARYSVDKVSVCGGPDAAGYMTASECESRARAGVTGVGTGKTSDYEVSYTAGLDWQINPDTLLYFTTRHGYRAANVNTPIFNTIYTQGAPASCSLGGVIKNCPDLRPFQTIEPEKITDYELGVKNDWYIGDVKGRINAAAYTMSYKKAVQFLNFQTSGIPAAFAPSSGSVGVNAADLTINGLEVDLTVVPIPDLVLTLSAAYTDQKIDDVSVPQILGSLPYTEDNVTLPSPEKSGSIAAAWTLPIHPLDGEVVLNGDYYYTSPFSGQDGENLKGYSLANFRLSWNGIAKSGLDVAAYVKNAFDKEYYISPTVLLETFPVGANMVGDPRTWGVEATYKF